jgi:hypothetical protein
MGHSNSTRQKRNREQERAFSALASRFEPVRPPAQPPEPATVDITAEESR